MELERVAKIYFDEDNGSASSVGTFLALTKNDRKLTAKEKDESVLVVTLTIEQQKLFGVFLDTWIELDTVLEMEAFRQGILTLEKGKSGHSLN